MIFVIYSQDLLETLNVLDIHARIGDSKYVEACNRFNIRFGKFVQAWKDSGEDDFNVNC